MGRRRSQISGIVLSVFAFMGAATIVIIVTWGTTSRNHNLPPPGTEQKGEEAIDTTLALSSEMLQLTKQQQTCDDFRIVGLVCNPPGTRIPGAVNACPAAYAGGCQPYAGGGITTRYWMCLNQTAVYHYEYYCDQCASRVDAAFRQQNIINPICLTDTRKASPPNVLCLYVCGADLGVS
jgi:hypothetical protein